MSNTFGENIRRFRTEKGLKQPHFAEAVANMLSEKNKCDFAKSVSKWENGDNYPKMEVILAIAEYMGVTLDELFHDEIAEFKQDAQKSTVTGKFKEWEDEELEFLYNALQNLSFGKWTDDEKGEYECFSCKISFEEHELNGDPCLYHIGKLPLGKIEAALAEWVKTDYLMKYIKRGIFESESCDVSYDNGFEYDLEAGGNLPAHEPQYVAEIPLCLDLDEIKDLFNEHIRRKMDKLMRHSLIV